MNQFQRNIESALRPLQQRILFTIGQGVVESVDNDTGIQTAKVQLMQGEVRDGITRIQNHGFASIPPSGSEAVLGFVNGNREHGFVLAAEKRGERPDLEPGDSLVYSSSSDFIAARAGGKFEIKNAAGELITELDKLMDALLAEPFIVNKATISAIKVILTTMKVI